mgnify:CR=1 FL=1
MITEHELIARQTTTQELINSDEKGYVFRQRDNDNSEIDSSNMFLNLPGMKDGKPKLKNKNSSSSSQNELQKLSFNL